MMGRGETNHGTVATGDDGRQGPARLSLRWNFAWNLVGNVVYAACQWGMVIVLAKWSSPEMLGTFALGLAITAPLFLLSGLALCPLLATDAHGEYCFGHYLALRLLTSILALAVLVGIVGSGGYSSQQADLILLIGCSKALESISDILLGLLQRHERMDRIALSRMMKGLGSLGALAVLVIWTGNLFWGVLAMAGIWGLVLAVYEVPQAIRVAQNAMPGPHPVSGWSFIRPDFEKAPLLRLTWLALPVGIVMGLGSLQSAIPRYFIERWCGMAELGIFAALAYLVVAGNTLMASLAQACSPRLAICHVRGDRDGFLRLLRWLVGIGAGVGVGGVVLSLAGGSILITMLYRPEYAEYLSLFRRLMLAGACAYVAAPFGYAMTAARQLRPQLPLFLLACGATCGVAWVLIPQCGLNGAAYAMIAGTAVQLAGSVAVVVRVVTRLGGRA